MLRTFKLMGFFFSTLILLSLAISDITTAQTREIKSIHLLDLVIRDYTFKSPSIKKLKTGRIRHMDLPSNFSGIDIDTMRLRCSNLRIYGAKIKEFQLQTGSNIHPCPQRVILLRQNLGFNWSNIYYENYKLSGYKLISPVLGLLAYNVHSSNITTMPSDLVIQTGKNPIIIDFSNATLLNTTSGINPLCATFDSDRKVVLSIQVSPNVCIATRQGHFGLVVESPMTPLKRRESKWKIAIGSSIGAALGAFLLSLLLIAMFFNAKKKARMDEMVRRAYEEEALQVSMVGHVRAVMASSMRTGPRIEHYVCRHPPT